MMKFDPHRSEHCYKKWRYEENGEFKGLTKENADLLRQYLDDMEVGANVSPVTRKGPRSYIRLRNLKTKIHSWALIIQEEIGVQFLPDLEGKERELLVLIKKMRDGKICGRKPKGKPLTAPGTYVKALKSFWHWYQRIKRKQGINIQDITMDLDGRDNKPKFCYFTMEDLNKMCQEATYDYRVLMMFLFDSGIRAPTEMMNIRVKDLEWNEQDKYYTLNIRNEVSKTFGRRIKLLLCSTLLKEYIKNRKIKEEEYIFTTRPSQVNQVLKRLGNRVLKLGKLIKIKKIRSGYYHQIQDGLTMYDFRHCSACYWLPRYKSESALKYRFGWKKSDMIHYYTELLGMKDTIQEDDLFIDISKTELERKYEQRGKEVHLLQEQIKNHESQMNEIFEVLRVLKLEKLVSSNTFSETQP